MSDNAVEKYEKNEVQSPDGVERMSPRKVFKPRADICEMENHLMIVMDVPGAKEENTDITVEKNELHVLARVDAHMPEKHSLIYGEYETGDYERTFVISTDEIDRDGIEASLKDGVLRLVLPKAKEAKARKVMISGA